MKSNSKTIDSHPLFEKALAAFQRDEADQSWHYAKQAAEATPDSFDVQNLAGAAALSAGAYESAIHHFACAVRLAPTPQAEAANWLGSGRAWLSLARSDRAYTAFRRGLSLAPNWPPLQTGLATALNDLGRHAEAEAMARSALQANPKDVVAQVILGASLIQQDQFEEAAELLEPLANDRFSGLQARNYLALLRQVSGDLDGARKRLREILDDAPDFPAYAQLSQLKRFTSRDDSDLIRLESRLEKIDELVPPEQVDTLFALAKAYDDLGEVEKAKPLLIRANNLESINKPYQKEQHEGRMARIEKLFTEEFIHAYPDAGLKELRPIFVVSLPRSGSTLIEQMIASHSKVCGGGELGHFARVANALSLKWGARKDFPNIDPVAAANDLREAGDRYRDLTARLTLLHPYFTDKSLENILYVGLIPMMLPDAKIVHIRRHPLATALGLYRQRFAQAVRYSYDLDHIASYYKAYTRLMDHWRQVASKNFIEVFQENLVAHPKAVLTDIFDYVGLEFEPHCLDFHRLQRPVHTASAAQVRRPIEEVGLTRHERYADLLAPVSDALAKEIAQYEDDLKRHLLELERRDVDNH